MVVGDETDEVVKYRTERTIRWAISRLKKAFDFQDPQEIHEIWLFKDDQSYLRNTKSLFGIQPSTPFGFYVEKGRALIMNIETGAGTLVHEIVHPYVRANFPKCPPWFFEGLGSLYEQSHDKNGEIAGLPNWRLPGLQSVIGKGTLKTFKVLTAMTDEQFYGAEDSDLNYAQARYLCYYLQEQGVLRKYYQEFQANQGTDPTGYLTLQRVLGRADMGAFQKEWEEFVLGLAL